jgi:hypothetical protein
MTQVKGLSRKEWMVLALAPCMEKGRPTKDIPRSLLMTIRRMTWKGKSLEAIRLELGIEMSGVAFSKKCKALGIQGKYQVDQRKGRNHAAD